MSRLTHDEGERERKRDDPETKQTIKLHPRVDYWVLAAALPSLLSSPLTPSIRLMKILE